MTNTDKSLSVLVELVQSLDKLERMNPSEEVPLTSLISPDNLSWLTEDPAGARVVLSAFADSLWERLRLLNQDLFNSIDLADFPLTSLSPDSPMSEEDEAISREFLMAARDFTEKPALGSGREVLAVLLYASMFVRAAFLVFNPSPRTTG